MEQAQLAVQRAVEEGGGSAGTEVQSDTLGLERDPLDEIPEAEHVEVEEDFGDVFCRECDSDPDRDVVDLMEEDSEDVSECELPDD